MSERRARLLGLLAAPLASLASFLAAYFLNPLGFAGQSALAAVPALLFSIVVLLVGQTMSALRELERASADSRRVYDAVRDYLHVTRVGSVATALAYVTARLNSMEQVRNTSFNVPDETDRSDDKIYSEPAYSAFAREIAARTAQGLRWRDIGDPGAAKRMRVLSAAASADPRRTSRYQYRLIAHSEPQMNFVLLSYPDGTEEVLFNWDFRSVERDPVVLLSRDREVVGMFAVQFEYLWRAASPDHDRKATRSTSRK